MKKFYLILRSDAKVETFSRSYKQIEKQFPDLLKKINNSMMSVEDAHDLEHTRAIYEGIKDKISGQAGIARSSLNFYKKHASDLSASSIEQLEYILKSANAVLEDIEFIAKLYSEYIDLRTLVNSPMLANLFPPNSTDNPSSVEDKKPTNVAD